MAVDTNQFAAAVLHNLGAPVTPRNIAGIEGWAQAEGGAPHNNPLNTTQGEPGSGNFNSVGVKSYPNLQVAVKGTVDTLRNGRYGSIINALRSQDPNALAAAIGSSPWGTNGALVSQTIQQALRSNPRVPVGGMGRATTFQIPGMAFRTPGVPGQTYQTSIGGGVNLQALADAVLRKEASVPINTSGKVTAGRNVLGDYVSAMRSGKYDAATTASSETIPGVAGQTFPGRTTTVSGSLRTGTLGALTGHGSNLNPLSHPDWKIGRTDMGVDAHAIPGTPIEAINDSKVVQIVPNWYSGQPLVLMQLTAGPDAGKYWYASEQIAQLPHVGQRIARGQTVAVYAPHGTGIEIGWGDPSTNSRTAAGPHYSEGAVTPEGADFLHHVLGR